jgi:hypothetical protein
MVIFDSICPLRDKKCNLKRCNYETMQVNEAIMQNTSGPPHSTFYLARRETSLWISLHLSVRLIHLVGLSAA